ncbi:neuropeptide CCHamide-2 receptor-like [Mytilus galloprovincialis]|uniref:neuropeptide CCHamide-2 receptor-like n=1 Tax=Mytilus galloprovincialis TaxID=29158 RepID=UPI003F7C2215
MSDLSTVSSNFTDACLCIYNDSATFLNNSCCQFMDTRPAEDKLRKIIVPIIFVLFMIVGVTGNGTLVYIVLRNKLLRNVPNTLIVNLSIGDLLLLIFSVPYMAIVFGTKEYPFNAFFCKLNAYLQTLSLGVSIFTLTALSYDRYVAIVHPMSKHKGKPSLKIAVVVIVIWVASALIAISDAVSYTLVIQPGGLTFCHEVPYNDYGISFLRVRNVIRLFILFIIPLFIIGCFYILMARILVKSSRQLPCEATLGQGMNTQQQRQIEARFKVAKVVLSFVVLFVICWLPRHIYVLWYAYDEEGFTEFWMIFKVVSICFMYAYSCVNPYALYFLSSQFRKYYNRYLFRCCIRSRYRTRDSTSALTNFNSTVRRGSTSMTMVKSNSEF